MWNGRSSLTNGGGNPTTKFAAGASVVILLGERTPAYGEKIVSWAAGDKPAASVSLTNGTYVLRAESNGLYVDSLRVFNPAFLPDIASARIASDIESAINSALSVTNLVTDFPVLVRLSESIRGFHYSDCPPDKLRFTLADGTLLPHEIDWWNENGESTVLVNVPELTADTVIRAHWGSARGPLARPVRETWPEYVGATGTQKYPQMMRTAPTMLILR